MAPTGTPMNEGEKNSYIVVTQELPRRATITLKSTVTPLSTRQSLWEPIIRSSAILWGADPDLMVRVARCESGFNPDAKNAHSTASGMYQFINGTWESQSSKYKVYTTKNDPHGQIEVATRMIADSGISHWNASKSCWGR